MKHPCTYTLVLLLCVAALLGGCTKEQVGVEDGNSPAPYDPAQPIAFAAQVSAATRGTPLSDAAELRSMGVFCAATQADEWNAAAELNKMFDQRLHRSADGWQYEGASVYWDAEDLTHRYTFFAYAPCAAADNGLTVNAGRSSGKPVLRYAVPADVTQQPDLMLALPRYNLRPTGSLVALQMRHALTCVGFQVAGDGEQVTAISLSGVAMTGEVEVDGGSIAWTNLGEPATADFSASLRYDEGQSYYTATADMSTSLIAADGYLMMIPQALGSNAKVKVSLSDGSAVEVSLNAHTWEAGQRVCYNISFTPVGSIILTPSVATLPAREVTTATDNFELMCQKKDGSPHPNALWTLSSRNPEWLRLSLDPNATFATAGASVSGRGSAPVYTLALANGGGSERTTAIYMGETKVADVKQLRQVASPNNGGTAPADVTTYIGAFWRATELGERVIRINIGATPANAGAWSAWVDWADNRWGYDGFALLPDGSTDPNIYTAAPGSAEEYRVPGSATAVSGTVEAGGSITFRIGLRKPFADFNDDQRPARYAVLLLAYGTPQKVQKLFLRQGEGADYVMLNSDPVSTGGITARTRCVRFSPYNLTATTVDRQVDAQGAATPSNPAKFADYPTQAGAFFQWSFQRYGFPSLIRYAHNPYRTSSSFAIFWTAWAENRVWSAISNRQECSPAGYRRPSDGSISAVAPSAAAGGPGVAESELRQSLWAKPFAAVGAQSGWNMDNTAWGYYADGFFDRRPIENARGGNARPSSAVAVTGNGVAYLGRLFFNPLPASERYNASLFFPATGYRNPENGSLTGAGSYGMYWSATTMATSISPDNSASGMRLDIGYTQLSPLLKTSGVAVRPVK